MIDLSSSLISVDKNSSIRYVIDLMIKLGIRNIGIRGDNEDSSKTNNHNNHNRKTKLLRIINDRKILEFLLSHDGRNIMRANGHILSIKKVKCQAELLMDIV